MEIFLDYLKVFAVGGALCALGQLLINKTQMSSARILVTFMLLGVVLELAGAFSSCSSAWCWSLREPSPT